MRQIIVVTFIGNRIPDCVKINMYNFQVEPFIYPIVQCFNCLRFGNNKFQCKGNIVLKK